MRHFLERCLVGCLLLIASTASADDRPRAFVGAKIIPIEGDEIANGVLVIEKGKITAVGAADAVQIPANAERVDVAGRTIMPGLICTHSHIGGSGGWRADGSGPIQPGVRIYDSHQRARLGLQAGRGRRIDDAQHHARLRAT